MEEQQIKEAVLKVLAEVAPEVEIETLDPERNFRDQFDFDSVDFLNFALGLDKALGIRIPELDYPKLSSLDGSVGYLAEAMAVNG